MKAWKNITLDLPGIDLRQVSEQLSILDVASILIKDNRSELESDWFDDPENPALLTGDTHSIALLMESGKSVTELLAEIQRILNIDKTLDYTEEYIEDVDWVAYTQTLFKETKISDSFRVVPPWEAEKKFNGKTIVIEPGRAFGTGSHPTTQLCLRWLETNLSIGDSLLDYGCGSGILSIGAKCLGAGQVSGVDLDQRTLKNAHQNNELNDMSIPFHPVNDFQPKTSYDVVMANILSSTLIKLSPILEKVTSNKLVLSGIINKRENEVIQAFSNWIKLSAEDELDGWVLLSGKLQT